MGAILGELALAGDVIALQGGLGAGKTLFTQGVARGMGIGADTRITSPTFGLVHEYQGRLPLFHLDLYRLAGEDDIEAAGLTDYLYGDGLAVIEWAERLGYLMPAQRLDIILKIMGENQRKACLTPQDGNWQERLAIFFGLWALRRQESLMIS